MILENKGQQNEKITELQLLLMEQERVIESYGCLLKDQQDQISMLSTRILVLEQKVVKNDGVGEFSGQHEIPPHY